jgi:hypothetical protein
MNGPISHPVPQDSKCEFEASIMSATTARELGSIYRLLRRRTHEHPHEVDKILDAFQRRIAELKRQLDNVEQEVRSELLENKIVP